MLEPVHAVTYFAPESSEACVDAGLKGFWMGYFAGRAAPMGEVGPAVVEATFFNFQRDMVRRAIPDAWSYASAAALLEVRAVAAAAALRRLVADIDRRCVCRCSGIDSRQPGAAPVRREPRRGLAVGSSRRPMAGDDNLARAPGDGHVSVLTSEGLDGCEAHVLFAMVNDVPRELYRRSRGWSDDEWFTAEDRLHARGAGQELHDRIEARTDAIAAAPYAAFSDEEFARVIALAGPIAATIAGSGLYPYPNPIGLPPPVYRGRGIRLEGGTGTEIDGASVPPST